MTLRDVSAKNSYYYWLHPKLGMVKSTGKPTQWSRRARGEKHHRSLRIEAVRGNPPSIDWESHARSPDLVEGGKVQA